MKLTIFIILSCILSTCSPIHPDERPLRIGQTTDTLEDTEYKQISELLWASIVDSVPATAIPGLCGTERMMRRRFWNVSGGRLWNHPSTHIRFNPHPYSCQEQLLLGDGFVYSLQGAFANNQDGYSPDTAYYPVMCRRQSALAPVYDSCWNGGFIYRKWAVHAGQLFDTLLIQRRVVRPGQPTTTITDTLFRP